MKFRALKQTEFIDWLDLCHEAFDLPSEYFERHFLKDPYRQIESIFVCEDKDKLVATVRVFHRKIYYNRMHIEMAGIGEVCTLPEYRGHGIASSLMDMAITYMKEKNFKVSVLGSGADKLYESFGYEHRPVHLNLLKAEMHDHGYLFTQLESNMYNEFTTMYNAYSQHINGSHVREPEYFKTWILDEVTRHESLAIYKDNHLIGYVVYDIIDDLNILELILENSCNSDDVLQNLLFHLNESRMIFLPDIYDTEFEIMKKNTNNNWMYLNLTNDDYSEVGNKHLIWRLDYY